MNEPSVVSLSYKYDPNYHRFADYMGIDAHKRKDFEVAKKLSMLYEWAMRESRSESFTKITGVVDQARRQQGVTFVGEPLVTFLYQRARLDMDRRRVAKEPEPTKRQRYDVKGSDEKIKSSEKQANKAREKGELAKQENVQYIKKYQKSIPKPKLEKIPEYDYSDTTSEKLS